MKIRIIAGHCLGNARDVFPGDVLEVDDALGQRKIKNGWAVAAKPEEPITFVLNPPPAEVAVPTEPSEPAIETPPAPATAEAGSGGRGRSSKN
jgi:hypothetical protein